MSTKETLAARKANGVKLGRKKEVLGESKLNQHEEEIWQQRSFGISYAKIGKRYGASPQTVSNWLKKYRVPINKLESP